jgi:hypothetical protein
MKKVLSFIMAVAFVAATFATASAEVAVSGDAKIYGVNMGDTTWGGGDAIRSYNHELRINFDGTTDVASAHVRLRLPNGTTMDKSAGITTGVDAADYSYVKTSVGGVGVTMGRQVINWGNKFRVWDGRMERFKLAKKFGGWVAALTLDKLKENVGSDANQDNNLMGVLAVGPVADGKLGVYILSKETYTAGTTDSAADMEMRAFYKGKVAGMGLRFELATMSGDSYTDDPMGVMVQVDPIEAAEVTIASTSNGYTANSHFTPVPGAIGTDAETGGWNVGQGGDELLIAANYTLPAGPFSVTAGLGMGMVSNVAGGADDYSVMSLGVVAEHALGETTTASLNLGYNSPDYDGADAASSMSWKIETKF